MMSPSTELIACCALVSTYTVRSLWCTVTPTVSKDTSVFNGSSAAAICKAAGQCGWEAGSSGQLAHWLNLSSVQNGGSAGGGLMSLKLAGSNLKCSVFCDPSGKSNR